MTDRRSLVLIAAALCLLAAELRFFRLGDWSFHGDELATLDETRSLIAGPDAAANSQIHRLPRLVPVSGYLQLFGHEVFGRDEFGSRVLPALLGTLCVLLVFLLLDQTAGRVTALATALLLALWPEHLYRSQENRFYMIAALFASLTMLSGALAVQRRSYLWTAAACLFAFAAVLSHTLQALLFGGLFLAIGLTAWVGRDRQLVRLLGVVLGGAAAAGVVFVVVLLPVLRGWNSGETWGYSVAHSVFAAISQLGWPVVLLAGLGILSIWKQGDIQTWYWSAWAAVWAGATVVLPFVVAYHPAYVFPLSLGVLVLAGRSIALIYEALREHNVPAAVAWLGLTCVLSLPSLVSYYADGSRYDFRAPAEFVSKHWQPGDRVGSFSPRLLRHYSKDGIEPIGLRVSHTLADVQKLSHQGERLWIVIPSSRSGKPEDLDRWLGRHCSLQMRHRPKRFDYYENVTEVFLYEPEHGLRVAAASVTDDTPD